MFDYEVLITVTGKLFEVHITTIYPIVIFFPPVLQVSHKQYQSLCCIYARVNVKKHEIRRAILQLPEEAIFTINKHDKLYVFKVKGVSYEILEGIEVFNGDFLEVLDFNKLKTIAQEYEDLGYSLSIQPYNNISAYIMVKYARPQILSSRRHLNRKLVSTYPYEPRLMSLIENTRQRYDEDGD